MEDSGIVTYDSFFIWNEYPQLNLRFIERDGKKVLQQFWVLLQHQAKDDRNMKTEWRDIPLVNPNQTALTKE
jgi:hypothetical protein